MDKCSVCGNPVIYKSLCNPCQKQKDTMEDIARQKKRDAAFGSPWDVLKKKENRMTESLIDRLEDLHKQATTDRSYYYERLLALGVTPWETSDNP